MRYQHNICVRTDINLKMNARCSPYCTIWNVRQSGGLNPRQNLILKRTRTSTAPSSFTQSTKDLMLQRLVAARVGGVAILGGGMGTFLDTHGIVEPLNPFTELNESKFERKGWRRKRRGRVGWNLLLGWSSACSLVRVDGKGYRKVVTRRLRNRESARAHIKMSCRIKINKDVR